MPSILELEPITANPQILHLELGSGCGNFGAIHYPECFLSDVETMSVLRERCGETISEKLQISAYQIPARDNRFAKVIMCNPYLYGFDDKNISATFFAELHRVLQPMGEVIVLATKSNKYGSASQIKNKLEATNSLDSLFSFRYIDINSTAQFPGYIFQNLTNKGQTFPNLLTTLTCLK